jgi:hypothetical protein
MGSLVNCHSDLISNSAFYTNRVAQYIQLGCIKANVAECQLRHTQLEFNKRVMSENMKPRIGLYCPHPPPPPH